MNINMNDINLLLQQAIREIEQLNNDEEFLIRDLFKGYEWNRIPRPIRLTLGTLFLNHVQSSLKDVIPINKTSSNQQLYKKGT